jgi:hypothetical protein
LPEEITANMKLLEKRDAHGCRLFLTMIDIARSADPIEN